MQKSENIGNLIGSSPYIEAAGQVDMQERIERLRLFVHNMDEWKKWRSIAFQLLNEGSIEYIATALHNRMGKYTYQCDHYIPASTTTKRGLSQSDL